VKYFIGVTLHGRKGGKHWPRIPKLVSHSVHTASVVLPALYLFDTGFFFQRKMAGALSSPVASSVEVNNSWTCIITHPSPMRFYGLVLLVAEGLYDFG
jgi:hypothetical protein